MPAPEDRSGTMPILRSAQVGFTRRVFDPVALDVVHHVVERQITGVRCHGLCRRTARGLMMAGLQVFDFRSHRDAILDSESAASEMCESLGLCIMFAEIAGDEPIQHQALLTVW